jgi:hypothetical protein
LTVLTSDGMAVRVDPAALIRFDSTWWQRLRADMTYAYRAAKTAVRSAWIVFRIGRAD